MKSYKTTCLIGSPSAVLQNFSGTMSNWSMRGNIFDLKHRRRLSIVFSMSHAGSHTSVNNTTKKLQFAFPTMSPSHHRVWKCSTKEYLRKKHNKSGDLTKR